MICPDPSDPGPTALSRRAQALDVTLRALDPDQLTADETEAVLELIELLTALIGPPSTAPRTGCGARKRR